MGADYKTVQSYFLLLEDTMMGFLLPVWHRSVRKRQSTRPKFYFFDMGVKRALDFTLSQELYEGTYHYGSAFEHFVILELYRLNDYHRRDYRFSYLRTPAGREIDLVIDRPGRPPALVEIKSSTHAGEEECATLNAFMEDITDAEAFCISRDPHRKEIGATTCVYYENAAGNWVWPSPKSLLPSRRKKVFLTPRGPVYFSFHANPARLDTIQWIFLTPTLTRRSS